MRKLLRFSSPCPGCNTTVSISLRRAGAQARCRGCRRRFGVDRDSEGALTLKEIDPHANRVQWVELLNVLRWIVVMGLVVFLGIAFLVGFQTGSALGGYGLRIGGMLVLLLLIFWDRTDLYRHEQRSR